MEQSEAGFIFPLTAAVSFLFLLYVTAVAHHYVIEKNFYVELSEKQHLRRLVELSTFDIITLIKNDQLTTKQGELHYPEGLAMYAVIESDEQEKVVKVTVTTPLERSWRVSYTVDRQTGVVSDWLEGK